MRRPAPISAASVRVAGCGPSSAASVAIIRCRRLTVACPAAQRVSPGPGNFLHPQRDREAGIPAASLRRYGWAAAREPKLRDLRVIRREHCALRRLIHLLLEGMVRTNLARTCHGRAAIDRLEPALQVWKRSQRIVAAQHVLAPIDSSPRRRYRRSCSLSRTMTSCPQDACRGFRSAARPPGEND